MLVPALVDWSEGFEEWRAFALSAALAGGLSALVAVATRGPREAVGRRAGFLLVTGVWISSSVISALPIALVLPHLSLAGALFEAMSGLTTTGATSIAGLDRLPPGVLLWRSMLQWFGGIGIVGMVILILPSLRSGGISLFRMESSDRSETLLPRVREFAAALMTAFVALTLLCAATYAALGMDVFDAVNHAMTTVSTAGFSTHDASFGHYRDDPAMLVAAIVFMIAGALPFVLYIRLFMPHGLVGWRDPQVTLFLALLVGLTLVVAISRRLEEGVPFGQALLSSAFHVVSVTTTTGFAAEDYTLWSHAAVAVFFLATFLGGCGGSTTGGLKTYRLVILFVVVRAALRQMARPHLVQPLRYGGAELAEEQVRIVVIYVFLFVVFLLLGTVALAFLGLDLVTAFTGSLSGIANVGPAFGPVIGPAGNFSRFSDPALLVMTLLMLVGRLEVVTVAILLYPPAWRN